MRLLKSFVAGFIAVLAFHQSALALLYAVGFSSRRPWALAPTSPFGVPQTLSLAFWGGVWGIVLGIWLARQSKKRYWSSAILFGAAAPTLVAWFIVAPLKGQPLAAGWDLQSMLAGVCVNAAWGFGTAALIRALR